MAEVKAEMVYKGKVVKVLNIISEIVAGEIKAAVKELIEHDQALVVLVATVMTVAQVNTE